TSGGRSRAASRERPFPVPSRPIAAYLKERSSSATLFGGNHGDSPSPDSASSPRRRRRKRASARPDRAGGVGRFDRRASRLEEAPVRRAGEAPFLCQRLQERRGR